MLRIVLKDGSVREYTSKQFTDYDWRPEAFIVLRDNQWLAIFNWDSVKEVLYIDDEKTN